MKNLYGSFKKEIADKSCCYSYFIKHRSFYVKPPIVDGRETCLCKTHINNQYMRNALHKNKIPHKNMNNFIAGTVYSIYKRA